MLLEISAMLLYIIIMKRIWKKIMKMKLKRNEKKYHLKRTLNTVENGIHDARAEVD